MALKADGLRLSQIQEVASEKPARASQQLADNIERLRHELEVAERYTTISRELLARASNEPICSLEDRPHFVGTDMDNDLFHKSSPHASKAIRQSYLPLIEMAPMTTGAIVYLPSDDGRALVFSQRSTITEYRYLTEQTNQPIDLSDRHLVDYPALPGCFHVSMSYSNATSDQEAGDMLVKLLDEHKPNARVTGPVVGRLLHLQSISPINDADERLVYWAEYWLPFAE